VLLGRESQILKKDKIFQQKKTQNKELCGFEEKIANNIWSFSELFDH